MEMGGKNSLVVLDDAELERAVQCALEGAFFASGQRCLEPHHRHESNPRPVRRRT